VKEERYTPNQAAISRLVGEIKQAEVKPLILIHGGGSYGHPIAKDHQIKGGYREPSQLQGFAKTHQAMVTLNGMVLEALLQEDIPSMSLPPSAFLTTDRGRIRFLELRPILKLLELGVLPVLYGDAVLDSTLGFTILSGDQLAAHLAIKLNAGRIIMGIDVDGIYSRNPKTDPSAQLIPHLTLHELREVLKHLQEETVEEADVTGSMAGKIQELIPALKRGAQALIVNAEKPGNIYKALKREQVLGTTLQAV
jgi:isopentenyl phosphate kinase